ARLRSQPPAAFCPYTTLFRALRGRGRLGEVVGRSSYAPQRHHGIAQLHAQLVAGAEGGSHTCTELAAERAALRRVVQDHRARVDCAALLESSGERYRAA